MPTATDTSLGKHVEIMGVVSAAETDTGAAPTTEADMSAGGDANAGVCGGYGVASAAVDSVGDTNTSAAVKVGNARRPRGKRGR